MLTKVMVAVWRLECGVEPAESVQEEESNEEQE